MSFRWITMFRRGSWTAFRKFALEEHKDFDRRVAEIDKQIQTIGAVRVFYKRDEESNLATQRRTGVYVREGTSLHKLCMAYVAHGGNILDISMFLDPALTSQYEDKDATAQHPMGGVISPLSGSAGDEVFVGGWVGLDKHYFWKVGRAEIDIKALRKTSSKIQMIRGSIEKEIKAKRNRLEEKIIKLCDLREQLVKEKQYIEMARGRSPEIEFTNQYHISLIDRVFWHESEEIPFNNNPEKPRIYDRADLERDDIDLEEGLALRTFYVNLFEDAESDLSEKGYPTTAL